MDDKILQNNSNDRVRCDNPICGGTGDCCTCRLGETDTTDWEIPIQLNVAENVKKNIWDCDIAIDLGTTTLIFALVEQTSAKVLYTYAMINKQRRFGHDVISRIQASNDGKKIELQSCILKDLEDGIRDLMKEYCAKTNIEITIHKVVTAGNTTMVHLLKGYSCDRLGCSPFQPVTVDMIREENCTIFPGISAFIGGDILAGIYGLDFQKKEEINLLIDLGTNGEMVLGNRDKMLVTSVAAGPAFEGGNISCGTGSVSGAVYAADFIDGKLRIKTIRDKNPCGVCGTGLIEIISELLENGIIDETGLLSDEYFETGFEIAVGDNGKKLLLTQKDIREFQLAKAAVRSGIELLILRYGITEEQIKNVYIAGSFGNRLNIEKASQTGMLPNGLRKKSVAAGNTCLKGLVRYLHDTDADKVLKEIKQTVNQVILTEDPKFTDRYLKYMSFE